VGSDWAHKNVKLRQVKEKEKGLCNCVGEDNHGTCAKRDFPNTNPVGEVPNKIDTNKKSRQRGEGTQRQEKKRKKSLWTQLYFSGAEEHENWYNKNCHREFPAFV